MLKSSISDKNSKMPYKEALLKSGYNIDEGPENETCKGHDTVVSLSAGDDTRPAKA